MINSGLNADTRAECQAVLRKLGKQPSSENAELWLPGDVELSALQESLLDGLPIACKRYSAIEVGKLVYRSRAQEMKEGKELKTVQRYFSTEYVYQDPEAPNDPSATVKEERYGEVIDIMALEMGAETFFLIRARWYKREAVKVHVATQTVRINLSLAWEPSKEDIIEADVVKSQVVICPLPYKGQTFDRCPAEAIVLDRKFDTLVLGGAV